MVGPEIRVDLGEEKEVLLEEVNFKEKSLTKAQQLEDLECQGKWQTKIRIDVTTATSLDILQQNALRKIKVLVRSPQKVKSLKTTLMLMEVQKNPNWPLPRPFPRLMRMHWQQCDSPLRIRTPYRKERPGS